MFVKLSTEGSAHSAWFGLPSQFDNFQTKGQITHKFKLKSNSGQKKDMGVSCFFFVAFCGLLSGHASVSHRVHVDEHQYVKMYSRYPVRYIFFFQVQAKIKGKGVI